MSSFLTKLRNEKHSVQNPRSHISGKFKPFQNERDSMGRLIQKSGSFTRSKINRKKLEESYKRVDSLNNSSHRTSELERMNPGSLEMKLNKIFKRDYILGKIQKK